VRTEYVGPQVGKQLRNDGILAVIYAIGMILIYVGFRFDFRFSPGVVIALIHDAIVTLGYFVVTRHEFNLTAVTVILTVVGYSVNDTIVIYDRIRENAKRYKGKPLRDLVNLSINEMLGRTILTSGATALSLLGLIVYGVGTIQDFALAMLVGIISGTYSTWYIASPMTIWLEEHAAQRRVQFSERFARVVFQRPLEGTPHLHDAICQLRRERTLPPGKPVRNGFDCCRKICSFAKPQAETRGAKPPLPGPGG